MNLCIIPARGGSKRIPKKNIKEFCGKPLIAYSIEVAKKSELFDKIVVSTDSEEIAKVAEYYGVEIQIRPDKLSDDYASSMEVFDYVISQNPGFKYACMIYATAPFLQVKYLKKGLEVLKQNDVCYTFSATTYDFPIQRGFKIIDNKAKMFYPEFLNTRSQDLEEAYHDAGQFYFKKVECKEKFRFDGNIPIIIPRYLVQDIDTIEDFIRAENMYKAIYTDRFDEWNFLKKQLNKKIEDIFIREREIYFIHIGQNIGHEQNGHEKFLRPVLILRKLSHNYFIGVPLSSKEKMGNYFYKFSYKHNRNSYALLNQIRVFDTKRIVYKSGTIKRKDFKIIQQKAASLIYPSKDGFGTSQKGGSNS